MLEIVIIIVLLGYGACASFGYALAVQKIEQIHVLVNSRLSEAIDKIENLEARVEELGGEPAPQTRVERDEEAKRDISRRAEADARRQADASQARKDA